MAEPRRATVVHVGELSDDDEDEDGSDVPLDQRASLMADEDAPDLPPPPPPALACDTPVGHVVRIDGKLFRRLEEAADAAQLERTAFLHGFELKPIEHRMLGHRSPAGERTPRWALDYQMPRAALTHHFDVQALFAQRLDEQSAATTPRKKGGTLRRLRKARDAVDARKARLELSKKQIGLLNAETERITLELCERVDIFTALLAEIAGVSAKEQLMSIGTLAELFLVDYTVTQHPNLKALGMPDNRLILEASRATLYAFACSAAIEAGYRLVDAERHRDAVLRNLGVWLDKTFGSEAANGSLPVAWNLSEDEHTSLAPEVIVARRNNRLMRETPLLMLGVLQHLELTQSVGALLRRWWRDCI